MRENGIFKAYDIRGKVGEDAINPAVMEQVGFVFAEMTEASGVAVGRDCRLSSPPLQQAFMDGVTKAGKDVLDVGQATSDTVYYASAKDNLAAAVITASHNPPDHNGVKLCRSSASHFSGRDIEEIGRRLPLPALPEPRAGRLEPKDISADYADHLLRLADSYGTVGELRLGVDCGNGTAGPLVRALSGRLPVELTGIYMEPDGRFPNHPANPSDIRNLRDLVRSRLKGGPGLGRGF